MRIRLSAFTAAVVLATLPAVAAELPETPKLTLQDIAGLEGVGDAVPSPDGLTVALVRGSQIVLLPSDGGWPVTLTSTPGGKSGLAWSPDGKQLAYVSQGSIWTVPVAGGEAHRLTNAPAGEGDPRQATDRAPQWSPDGLWILFESGRRGIGSLLVVSADGDSTSFLTSPKAEAGAASWSPKGDAIVFVERAKEYFSGRLELLRFDTATGQRRGEPKVLYTAPVDRGGGWAIRGAQWSPDGKELVTVLQNAGWDHLYRLSVEGGEPQALTQGAADDEYPRFSPDGRSIVFVSNRGLAEATGLWSIPAVGGAPRELTHFETPGISAQPRWSKNGGHLFFEHQSPLETADLFVLDLDTKQAPRQLTHTTPRLYEATAQVPERVTWRSKDGREIAGLLYKPRPSDTSGRLPLVVWVHGGPESQDGYRADGWAQFLAQSGYLVLEPNYRGSSGYGEEFRNLNVEDSNGGEVDDVASGAQSLVDKGLADPKRLAIGGGSHGGTMTAYMVVHYPDLFAAAIELYGVVDRDLFVQRTNPDSSTRWAMKMGGLPDKKPDVYAKANVLLQVEKVKTPLLVMHGEDDPQVPPANSAEFVKTLRSHRKTVFYFTYPHELHGFAQPQHRLDAQQKEIAFLEHYIKPKYGTTSTSTEEIAFPKESTANAHN